MHYWNQRTLFWKVLIILKLAISVQSQNSGFGLPSSFSWIDKYQSSSFSNPFADDIFDPFQNQRHQPHSSDGMTTCFIALFSLFLGIWFLLICWRLGNLHDLVVSYAFCLLLKMCGVVSLHMSLVLLCKTFAKKVNLHASIIWKL